ncbi:8508_t:CDS:2 [Rhizophagus irregularis]|nr:8508_t:CDS:2 [Rhizophagus irregularis]
MIPVLFSFFSINNPVDQAVAFRFHTCYRNRRHANGKWLGVINGLSVVEFYIEENIGEREPRDYIASQTPLSVQQNQRNQSKHAQYPIMLKKTTSEKYCLALLVPTGRNNNTIRSLTITPFSSPERDVVISEGHFLMSKPSCDLGYLRADINVRANCELPLQSNKLI